MKIPEVKIEIPYNETENIMEMKIVKEKYEGKNITVIEGELSDMPLPLIQAALIDTAKMQDGKYSDKDAENLYFYGKNVKIELIIGDVYFRTSFNKEDIKIIKNILKWK